MEPSGELPTRSNTLERWTGPCRITSLPGPVRPFSHRFAACLGAVLVSGRHENAPRAIPEGPLRQSWIRYLAVTSDSARWKNRARPTIRRTIFAACVAESLNADFNSAAISSFPLPDRNR
jgi:hypothetical protein